MVLSYVRFRDGGDISKYTELYNKLNLHVPFDNDVVAPFGSMFWGRGKGFKSIFNYQWRHDDFPCEPLENDGTISHAIERIYGYSVQNDGFYVGYCATNDYISIYLDNLLYSHREINKIIHEKVIVGDFLNTYSVLKNEVIYVAKSDNMCKILIIGLKLRKIRYDILSKITFGKMRRHYKYKKEKYNILLKGLKESKG